MLIEHSEPHIFLKMIWYRKDIVSEDPQIRGITRITCSGLQSDYDQGSDMFFRPQHVDYQVFYANWQSCKMPGVYNVPPNQSWLWTGKEVTSSLTIGGHMLVDEGMIIEHDEAD